MSFQRIAPRLWMSAAALALCAGLPAHAADAPEAAVPAAAQTATPAADAPAASPTATPVAPQAVVPAAVVPAVVPTGPAITIDFAPLPNRTVYARYTNDVKMTMTVDAAGETADAPKTEVKKVEVSMKMAIGTRQANGARAKDGSMTVTGTTESFKMDIQPDEVARMMQAEIGDLDALVGTRTISRVNADGSYDLIRVEPAKGRDKLTDLGLRQNEVDQWVTQIPQGKHTLHVGETLGMKVNYPSQGGIMPTALEMDLVFTLKKIDGTLATFDVAPKIRFESENPMFKDPQVSGGGTLVFDTKQHLVQSLELKLKLDAHAEIGSGPGMVMSTSIEAVAAGSESLKPFAKPAAAKAPAKKAKQKG